MMDCWEPDEDRGPSWRDVGVWIGGVVIALAAAVALVVI